MGTPAASQSTPDSSAPSASGPSASERSASERSASERSTSESGASGSQGSGPRARLAELGLVLPAVAAPAGSYVPAARAGALVFTAGQLPFVDGRLELTGKVGAEVSSEQANRLARVCALNALAAVDDLVGLDRVVRVVRVGGFVASAADFTGQPGVINGASDLLAEVFGSAGRHARAAVGVAVLPLDSPVEVDLIVEISEE